MTNDAPIIDDYDSHDPGRGKRNRNWGFAKMKSSMARSMHSNGLLSSGGSETYNQGDLRSKRRSWKDLTSIRESLKSMADTLLDESKKSDKEKNSSRSGYAKSRREWFAKIRYQNQLLSRLRGIEKAMKGKEGGGSGLAMLGTLGALGALGKLIKNLADKGVVKSLLKNGGSEVAKNALKGVLAALLARSALGLAIKGIGKTAALLYNLAKRSPSKVKEKVKGFGGKAKAALGTGLKAGKSKILSVILPSLGLGGLAQLLGQSGTTKGAGSIFTGLMRSVLPKILGRIGMAVFGVPGVIASVSKLVWDHLIPEKWKRYITYRVAKFYLQAIDRVSQLFEWIANKVDEIRRAIQSRIISIFTRVYAALNFISQLITGQGEARARVKSFFTNVWATLESTIKTYIGGFLTVFREAYKSFVKPFYDEKGQFSLLRGITHYAKAGYNLGVDAIKQADNIVTNAVDSVRGSIDKILNSNWNPANWRKNAEVYVQGYENQQKQEAASDKPDASSKTIAKAQDKASQVFGKLDKTLSTTNKTLRSVATSFGSGLGGSQGDYYGEGGMFGGGGGGTDFGPASGSGKVETGSFAHLIAGHESGKAGYNAFNNGQAGVSKGSYNLTSMTLGQIKQLQSHSNPGGRKLFAVGKYQLIPETLKAAQAKLGLSDNTVFSPAVQDAMLTGYLVKDKRPALRDYITGRSNSLVGAQVAFAQEFASVGMPYTGSLQVGKKTYSFRKDGSFYAGMGGNKASMSSAKSAQLLQTVRSNYQAGIAQGLSPNQAWNKAFGTSVTMGGTTGGSHTGAGGSMSGGAVDQPQTQLSGDSQPQAQMQQPQTTDMVGVLVSGMSNPETARQMYEGAKATYDTSVRIPKPPANNNIMDRDAILKSMEGGTGVNTMSRQVAKENPVTNVRAATSNFNSYRSQSKSISSSPSDLFSRANFANVMHENAFPS